MILTSLIKCSGHQVFFPFYHAVDNEYQPHIKHLYPVKSIHQFENELDTLLKHFKPIDLDKLISLNQSNEKPKKPSIHLSFDDGLRQCYDIIAPILNKRGIPATFFINSAFVENKDLMYRYKISLLVEEGMLFSKLRESLTINDVEQLNKIDTDGLFKTFLKEHRPYMTLEQIKGLESQGFTIGGHSHTHPYFKDISLAQQIEEVNTSIQYIHLNLNQRHSVFSFPFNDVSVTNDLFDSVDEEIDLFFSTGGIKADERSNVYRRTTMEDQNNLKSYLLNRYGLATLKRLLRIKHIHRR